MDAIRVLVVDNSPMIRKIISAGLKKKNYLVETASDGLEALDYIQVHRPDVVITDLIMPHIDGEKLCNIINSRQKEKKIFLIVLSAIAAESVGSLECLNADAYIAKGPALEMMKYIYTALERYAEGQEEQQLDICGLEDLFAREVTSELLMSKKHKEVILNEMAEGVLEFNRSGRIVMVNPAAVVLLQQAEVRILGKQFVSWLPVDKGEEIRLWIDDCLSGQDKDVFSITFASPVLIGEKEVVMNITPLREEDDIFFIAILQDVTHLKQLERQRETYHKQVQKTEKLEAMAVVAGGLSHDFNNLLTVVSGNLELAAMITREKKAEKLFDEARRGLDLMSQLVGKFATLSENYTVEIVTVELLPLLETALQQAVEGSRLSYEIHGENLRIQLDTQLVHQVFFNLVENTIDALDGKSGHVRVTITVVDGEKEAHLTHQPIPTGRVAKIVFHDSGPGIDPEIADQVFDPYFSTKKKGTQKGMGMGLTVVHFIIKKHGGAVWIDSAPEGGAVVSLYFPLREQP